jgi:hypothetical protein
MISITIIIIVKKKKRSNELKKDKNKENFSLKY